MWYGEERENKHGSDGKRGRLVVRCMKIKDQIQQGNVNNGDKLENE